MTSICVVIPLYNKAAHVGRAIASILNQTVPPSEIIVVDDASSDGGREIAARYPGVQVLTRAEPGPGGYAARNLAVRSTTSEYIAFLDADDEWSSTHLEVQTEMITRAPQETVLFCTGYDERHPGGKVIKDVYRRSAGRETLLDFKSFVRVWLDCGECPVWTSAILAKRTALMEAGLFPERRCRRGGDKDLWLRLADQGLVSINPIRSAIYHKDAENMVTTRSHDNQCHCIVETITDIKSRRPSSDRRLLTMLSNRETYLYALRTAKTQKVQRATWKHFNPWYSPLYYAILLAVSSSLYRPVAQLGIKLKKMGA